MRTLKRMKLFLAVVSIVIAFSGFTNGFSSTVTVTSPNGGETWTAGTMNAITYTSDIIGNLRITLMKGGVQCALIASRVPNTGSFNWMVPASIISGTDYTVKISYCINPLISDVSDANFTINGGVGSTITLTAPNGGETWTAGTSNIITWTSDVIGNVKIVLLKSGMQCSLIAASIPNTGSFAWRIPAGILAGTEYTVKIMSYVNPLLNDVSDANFTIVSGGGSFITLTAPNGGETLTAGTASVVSWTSDITGNVRIVLLKNGIQFALISSFIPNSGTFNWNIPVSMPTGTDYTVKISSCLKPLINDVSDANFTINGTGGSTITLTAPNGGESWTVGTTNTITWTSDILGNVRIVLLKGGIQVRLIASGTPNDGIHNWLTPVNVIPGTDYKIRISSCLNPAISDVSDLDFSIIATDNDTPGTAENSTVKSATGADELTTPNLKVFPNPATDRLYIVAGQTMSRVTLWSSLGKTVFLANPDSRQLTLNMDEFSAGFYFVRIETEGVITTHKIVIK